MFSMGPMNVYPIDIVYLLLVYVMARVIFSNKLLIVIKEGPLYLLFLLWLFLEVLIGYSRYGFRAFGEARYVITFLSFFVPFYLMNKKQQLNPEYIANLIFKTIYCCAVACLLVYMFNVLFGYDTGITDFRGVRYIGSTHTFYITLLVCFYALQYAYLHRLTFSEIVILILSIAVAILSKNRAGLIFPIAITGLLYAKRGKIKVITYAIIVAVLSIVAVRLITPEALLTQVDSAFSGALDPTTDVTGRWRLAVQGVALQQALETFWFGQGYGGYFSFLVPGMNWSLPIEYPPHNQFLVVFLKAGIFGAILCLLTVLSYIYRSFKVSRVLDVSTRSYLSVMILLVVISSQLFYGQTYDFIPLYGLYYGFGVMLMRAVKIKNTVKA